MLLLLTGCTLFIDPTEGTYMATVQDFVAEDTCAGIWELDLEGLQSANATDVTLGEDGESMTLDGTIPCERFGLDFTCVFADEEKVRGSDATFQTRVTIDGEWISSFAFDSDWELSTSCLGADCGEYSESCLVSWTFDAGLVE
ncbi:MAG: hypothetical protein Q8P18_25515 [Pseudomonadota bacterium]|nr:hypothetical protein [Pseudomonadota bacterium]